MRRVKAILSEVVIPLGPICIPVGVPVHKSYFHDLGEIMIFNPKRFNIG